MEKEERKISFEGFKKTVGENALIILSLGGKEISDDLLKRMNLKELGSTYNKAKENKLSKLAKAVKEELEGRAKYSPSAWEFWERAAEIFAGKARKVALAELATLAKTFKECRKILEMDEGDLSIGLRNALMWKMLEKATNFEELKELGEYSLPPQLRIALEKELVKRARNFQEWKGVFRLSSSGSEEEKKAMKEMISLAKTPEEWAQIYMVAPEGSPLEKLAKNNVLILIDLDDELSLETLFRVFNILYREEGDLSLLEKIEEKIWELVLKRASAFSFEILYALKESPYLTLTEEVEKALENVMDEKAETYDQYLKLAEKYTDAFEGRKKKIFAEKALEAARTFEEMEKVYQAVQFAEGVDLRKFLRPMLKKAGNFEEAWTVYEHIKRDFLDKKLQKEAFDKATELARKLEDWKKIFDSSDADEEIREKCLQEMLAQAKNLRELYYDVYLRTHNWKKSEKVKEIRKMAAERISEMVAL